MKLQIADLSTERKGRATTGTTPAKLEKLRCLVTTSSVEFYGQTVAQRPAESCQTPSLQSEQELCYFTLWSLKAGLTCDLLGFVGIEKDYSGKELFSPHKKPKKKELTLEQKVDNKVLASKRIVVEHVRAGLKRYHILSDRLRMHNLTTYKVTLGVGAGRWNCYLSH